MLRCLDSLSSLGATDLMTRLDNAIGKASCHTSGAAELYVWKGPEISIIHIIPSTI